MPCFEAALGANNVLTTIAFDDALNSAYAKSGHSASHYAVAVVAMALTLSGGTDESARIAVTGVSDSALRPSGVECALKGVRPTTRMC